MEIKVLGPGCPSCDRLEQDLMMVLEENGIKADLEHVKDFKEISKYGVMGSPALVINGKVKVVGSVPFRDRLKDFIRETQVQLNKQ
ncbi:MAG: thioredoxin family protein [Desulfobacula sp.]|nr:thioredoxin family protein [Desulfobacula sp.]